MMRKKTIKFFPAILITIVMLSIGDSCLFAQVDPTELEFGSDVSRRGTTAAAMLEIGVGSRAVALGGAFVATADDPSALYWNPAGIVQMKSFALQATQTEWFVGTNFSAIDLVLPLPAYSSALGFHLAMLDYGENPVRTVFRPEGTGEFYTAMDFVAGLYWALAITDRVSVGLGVKYFHENIWHLNGSAVAGDLSILFKTPFKGLRIGGALSNLGPEIGLSGRDLTTIADVDGRRDKYFNNNNVAINYATQTFALPLLFRFGMAYERQLNDKSSITFASNMNHPSNDVETLDLGLEARVYNMVFLRAGYRSLFSDVAEDGLTLGGGINYKILGSASITVDYAWADWGILSNVNRFTVGISAY
ncbi:MAG: hypothetical protein DWQ05_11485 [Calditrichaeota bacterium]|nr:MAG: hypothetical protein DWQ05_11485 [Calditrichota bacterium]